MDWNDISDKLGVIGEKVGIKLKGMFGSENERIVAGMRPLIKSINDLAPWAEGLERAGMLEKMDELRKAIAEKQLTLEGALPEVFAMVRVASERTLGLRPYDVQLVGGYVLHEGKIAEMMTGEGKTLVATLPLVLNALAGRKCYLVTVNDYLAKRDADWMRPVFEYMGLTVGSIQAAMNPWDRKPVYACDIVYSTNNELGFDYLRDNMKTRKEEQVQTDLYFAIVDEVDSVLIDEARTPLIISGPAEQHVGKYHEADAIVRQLERDVHYEVKEKEKSASLTEEGIVRAQELLEIDSFYTPGFEDWPHYLENSIRAYEIYKNDKEYVVEEVEDERRGTKGMEVIIVDDFTGRKMHGRRWSDGLHQAVEVKEGLEPKQETQTLATITFQNYFRMFEKLAGMTGTALTEAGEFHKIYELDVVSVPTNMPVLRHDAADTVYRTEPEKWRAIVEEIERLHEKGQPVLVGTASVDNSEKVSAMLKEAKIPHQVLNAKNNEAEKNAREANIVAKAGERGAVTVATNMAGRGTDIKLGGNFEHRLAEALEAKGLVEGDVEHLEEIDVIRSEVRAQCGLDEQEVLTLGGLYVLGTERHEARRIDNQLRGRSGRQGNAGESRFYLSLQDPLMRIFYRDWVTNAMERLGMSEGQAIESKMVTRAIAKAQRKVEDRNFEIRKSLLEYDEVMNTQRKTIYGVRQAVLEEDLSGPNGLTRVQQMMHNVAERQALVYLDDAPGFGEWIHRTYGFEIDEAVLTKATEKEAKDRDITGVLEAIDARYAERCEELGEELVARVEQYLLLNAIDGKWKDHLYAIDALKTGIGLRGYGQQDPKTIYKQEGTELFHEQLLPAIESEVASLVLRIQVRRPDDEHGEAGAGDGGDGPSGGGDQSLAPKGMVQGMVQGVGPGGASPGGQRPGQPTPAQIAAYRKQVNQMAARKAMRQQVPASSAFDLVQRQRGAAPKPAEAPMDFSGTGRNDICPCGSGKKFKKCHGAQ